MSKTNVPFVDLSRIVDRISEDVLKEWQHVLKAAEFVDPPRVRSLETLISLSLDCRNVYCCANGTDALVLALRAVEIGVGHLVAVPNITFWASYEAIVNVGAIPVLVDVDRRDLQMSLEELKIAHEKFKLHAVILPHLFGFASANLREIRTFCRRENIQLIEDRAPCFGVKFQGAGILTEAEIATLSFYPAKVIGGCMDGGAIVGLNAEKVSQAKKLANHGRDTHYSYSHVGTNSRMGGLQAAFLTEVLKISDEIIDSRLNALKLYKEFYDTSTDIHGIVDFVLPPEGIVGNGYLAMFLIKNKSSILVQEAMRANGIVCGRTYPETISAQKMCKHDLRSSEMSVSQSICREVINLPIFAFITADECQESFERFVDVLIR